MRVLCVAPSYYPAFKFGGPIFSVHELNKALVKKGVDVTVYTTNAGLEGKVVVNAEVSVDGVKVFYFAFSKLFEFLVGTEWRFSLPFTKALENNIEKFDIVYIATVWQYPIAIAAYYCRKYKKPYIISPRGMLYPYTIRKKLWKKWLYYNLVSKKDLKSAGAIHYTTEDEAKKCHSFLRLGNQAVVIPNGIDLSKFFIDFQGKEILKNRYPQLKDKKVILFLGRINWKKGLDILVKAYNMVLKERAGIHLLVVGGDEGKYKQKVEKWIKNYKITEMVTFTGILTGKEKLEAYAGSDIFLLPSYSENFGMSVVEAMACKLPVVITDQVGIYKDVEKYKAGIVTGCNSNQIAEALLTLLADGGIRKSMGESGRRLVEEKFTLDKLADVMIETYIEIISGSRQ